MPVCPYELNAVMGMSWAASLLRTSLQALGLCKPSTPYVGTCNGDVSCRDDFYSDPVASGYYKDHVRTLLTRKNTVNGRVYRYDITSGPRMLYRGPRTCHRPTTRNVVAHVDDLGWLFLRISLCIRMQALIASKLPADKLLLVYAGGLLEGARKTAARMPVR